MKQGKVWLVGAGPGDGGLLTVKGAQVLSKAEVVIYDALVSLEILCMIPVSAQAIYVGKRAGEHSMSQESINQLIADEALKGKRVVRLKGGDPFVFGRGGEEIEVLQEWGIDYEIVPGITSAIAAPAYAGIPVTHRDFTSSFHVVTGHARKGGQDRTDYGALARMDATLVFLMGVGQLEEIAAKLIENGLDPETPAAIIENGTVAEQRQLLSTLRELPAKAKEEAYKAPAVILVGRVAHLMGKLNWRKNLSLAGKTCIVTRSKEQGQALAEILRDKGAQVVHLPMINVRCKRESLSDFAAMLQEMNHNFFAENWIVLSSPNDVRCFFELLAETKMDIRSFNSRVRWAVVGEKTAKVLRQYGIRADLVPEKAYGYELAAALKRTVAMSAKVHVYKGSLGGSDVQDTMLNCGIPCEELVIYDTVIGLKTEFVTRIMEEAAKENCYVMFTSASCVEGFAKSMGEVNFSAVTAVCIGTKTAEAARQYGMQVLLAEEPSIASMIQVLESVE